jgi:hypothetical protein
MAIPAPAGQVQERGSAARVQEWATDQSLLASLGMLALGMAGVLYVFMRRLSLARFPDVVPTYEPLATALSVTEKGLTWFVLAFGILIVCYVLAYGVALRLGASRWGIALAFGVSLLLIGLMLPVFPGGAQDVYHNIADGRTLAIYGEDPITTPPTAHPDDPIVRQLADWQSTTSSYGPGWYLLAAIPAKLAGDGLVRNVVAQKLLVSSFLVGTLILVHLIVRQIRPQSATAAIVLLGWSPLALWEIAGNGHNDIVMMFFAVAALWAVVSGRWQLAFPFLALAVSVKFMMLLLGPLLLVWLLLRRPRVPLGQLVASMAVAGGILLLIYAPFLLASPTFANTTALEKRFISSPASLAIAFIMQYTSLDRAENLGRALALTVYGVGYLAVLWRCRGTFDRLVHAAFWATFLTLALPTWWFWPWYLVWLLPIAALTAGRKPASVALIFGSSALLVYAVYYWRNVLLNGPNWYANQFVIVGAVWGPVLLYLLGSSGLHLLTLDQSEPPPV